MALNMGKTRIVVDEVGMMYRGRVVREAKTDQVYTIDPAKRDEVLIDVFKLPGLYRSHKECYDAVEREYGARFQQFKTRQ